MYGFNIYMIEQEGVNVVTLYDEPNFGGRSVTLPVGTYECQHSHEMQFDDKL